MTLELTQSLFERYRPDADAYDVLVRSDGTLRDHWTHAVGALEGLGASELAGRRSVLDRMLDDEGISYRLVDRDVTTRWPLDPLPSLVPSAQWIEIESGVVQRAVVLDLVLRDLYGDRELLERGLLPPEVVFGHPGFLRPCDGITTGREQQLLTYAADLGQAPDGTNVVLTDRAQAPSGAGYALANRTMLSRVFPSLYRDSQVHRVAPYFRSLRAALERVAATARTDDPRIVLLTPGAQSETSFEHAYVGSSLGYPVVEGGDLTVRDGNVYLRALGRLEPVDVILRRADAEWCDPLELRGDSQLGVPGLVEATRRGSVAVVNPLGSGVLENAGLLPFLPAITEHFLGQELELPSVPTWWCGEDKARSHVLAHLDSMVVKPIGRAVGDTSSFCGRLSTDERDDLRRRIEAHPHRWVGQEQLRLSTVPTMVDGVVTPRPSTLRTFAVARGESYTVMAGGLTRVAPSADTLKISNQAGATSKDTWVLASEPENLSEFWLRAGPPTAATDPSSLSSRAAENLFWLGRYAERAESVTRMLRAVHDRREGSGPEGEDCVRTLLGALTLMTATA
ncbi:MAG: circularly permuted type 2 ATP-grasp protein, partial [Acidimicrobiales bacterium]|nr:circularly permuted type 2 ATP-grasp protein [Acidimicrobiales bacterium]